MTSAASPRLRLPSVSPPFLGLLLASRRCGPRWRAPRQQVAGVLRVRQVAGHTEPVAHHASRFFRCCPCLHRPEDHGPNLALRAVDAHQSRRPQAQKGCVAFLATRGTSSPQFWSDWRHTSRRLLCNLRCIAAAVQPSLQPSCSTSAPVAYFLSTPSACSSVCCTVCSTSFHLFARAPGVSPSHCATRGSLQSVACSTLAARTSKSRRTQVLVSCHSHPLPDRGDHKMY